MQPADSTQSSAARFSPLAARRYTHLFFDIDHTLWDFERSSEETLLALYEAHNLAKRGISSAALFLSRYRHHNEALWARFSQGAIRREELRWKRMWLTLLDLRVPDERLAHKLSNDYLTILPTQQYLLPGAEDLLAHCAGRYWLHLITNGFEATQWQKLESSRIAHHFGEMFTAERTGSPKPHDAMFIAALTTTGATPGTSLMIGDHVEIDARGALRSGLDAVWYNPAGAAAPPGQKPTYTVQNLADLLAVL